MDEIALVYEAAASRGISPRECDELEIVWLAAALGANRPDSDADPLTDDEGFTWNQRRAIALEQGLPEPQWDDVPMTAREIADLEKLASGAQVMVPPPNA